MSIVFKIERNEKLCELVSNATEICVNIMENVFENCEVIL